MSMNTKARLSRIEEKLQPPRRVITILKRDGDPKEQISRLRGVGRDQRA